MINFTSNFTCFAYCVGTYIFVYMVSIWFSLYQLITPHNKPKTVSQKGKVALITGGARGIGYETSIQLLNLGMTLVIVDVNTHKKDGIKELKKKYGKRLKVIDCDLSSIKAVRKAAQAFIAMKLPLNLLINNAGIMFAPYLETDDGYESHFAVNYLSHFLLTHLLLPCLIKSGDISSPSRVVNLSSCLHFAGTINFDDLQARNCYSAEAAYCQSKLAMAIFAKSLNSSLEKKNLPVIINSVHPAVAFSKLYENMFWANYMPFIGRILLKTPSMGSDTVIHAAISPLVTSGGYYFDNCSAAEPSAEVLSLRIQKRLYRVSCQLCRIKEVY